MRKLTSSPLLTPYPVGREGKKNLILISALFIGFCQWFVAFVAVFVVTHITYKFIPGESKTPRDLMLFFSAICATCIMLVATTPINAK